MLKCETCHTPNFAGDRFCRQCGISLTLPSGSEDPSALSPGEAERLLSQAFALLDQHAEEEALAQVHAVLAREPDCAPAHSLLSVILERQGKLREARQALERAVELDPECEADRERLAALRPRRGRLVLSPVQLGLACAVPSALLVLGVGLSLARGLHASTPERAAEGALEPALATTSIPTPADAASANLPALSAGNLPATQPPAGGNAAASTVPFGTAPAAVPTPPLARAPIAFGAGDPGGTPRGSFPRLPAPGETRPSTRIGLPEVVHEPRQPAQEGLPPAAIGEVVPLHAPPPAPQPFRQGAGAPPPGGPGAPVPGSGGPGMGAAAEKTEKPATRRELPEPETGFIKIGPVGSARQRPPQPPEPTRDEPASGRVQRPSISINIEGQGSPGADPAGPTKR